MSTGNTVDSKVVELSFDNSNFESNATKSLSTLERLKAALNFSKSTKGFDEVAASAKKFDPSTITSGVNTLHLSLKNLMTVSAFRFLSGEAEKLAQNVENVVKEMSGINGMTAGWDKYAEKTSAVQTIMAATAKDFTDTGVQMKYVNGQLDKLNWFTDETSYNFLDMVNNIGKFTSNNIALDKSVTAMEGISNWAAVSGANVNEAGRAMYNLSQAIATGAVKLMDWKSIENANMATAEFKQTAIDTAVNLGTLTKTTDGLYKTTKGTEVSITSFNQTLSEGWFTADVLMDTLGQYGEFTDKLHDSMEQLDVDVTTSEFLDYIEEYKNGTKDINEIAEELNVSSKDLKPVLTELSDSSMEFGMKAFRAAQEAKTFQEAIDSVKDAVSTGWMNTFEIIFGDYEQAKTLWTGVANGLWDVFASGGEARNDYLREVFQTEEMLNKGDWAKLEESGIASPEFVTNLRAAAKEHGVVISEIASDQRWLELALNKGKLSIDDVNKALANMGKTVPEVNEEIKGQVETVKESDESFKSILDTLNSYSGDDIEKVIFGDGNVAEGYEDLEHSLDSMMKTLGLSQDQGDEFVNVLKDMGYFGGLAAEETTGLTKEQQECVASMNEAKMTGSELFGEGLVNSISIVSNVLSTLRESFSSTFDGLSAGGFRDILEGFYTGTKRIKDLTENSETLKTVFSGLGSAANIVTKVLSGGLKIAGTAFGIAATAGGKFASMIANGVSALDSWLSKTNLIGKASDFISNKLTSGAAAVKGWIEGFMKTPIVSRNVDRFKGAFGKTMDSIPTFFDSAYKRYELFKKQLTNRGGIKELGISGAFDLFKKNVTGFVKGFKGFNAIKTAFKDFGTDVKESLSEAGINIDPFIDKAKSIGSVVKTGFSMIGPTFKTIGRLAKDAFAKFKELPVVQKAASGIKKAFAGISDSAKTFSKVTVDRMKDFVHHVKEDLGGISLDNIGTVFKDFGLTIGSIFEDSGVLKKIKTGAKKIGEEIGGEFVNFDGFKGISDAASNAFDTIIDAFSGKASISDVVESFSAIKDAIVETFTGTDFSETISSVLSSLGTSIKGFLNDKGINVDGIVEGFNKIKNAINGVLRDIKIPKNFSEFLDMILGVQTAFGEEVTEASNTTEKAGTELETSINSIFDVFDIIGEKSPLVGKVIDALNGPLGMFLGIILAFRTIPRQLFDPLDLIKSFSSLISSIAAQNKADAKLKKAIATFVKLGAIVGAIIGVVLALKLLDTLNPDTVLRNIAIVGGILTALVATSLILDKVGGKTAGLGSFKAGIGLFSLVMSIVGIIGLLKMLEIVKIDVGKILSNFDTVIAVIVALVGLVALTRLIGPNAGGAATTILALVGAIAALSLLMFFIGQMKWKNLGKGLVGVGLLTAFLAKLISASSNAKGALPTLLSLSILLAVVGNVFKTISELTWDGLVKGIVGVGLLAIFVDGILKASAKATSAAGPILALAVLIGTISVALFALANLPDQSALTNVALCIGGIILVLTLMGGIMGVVQPAWQGLLMLAIVVAAVGGIIFALTQIQDLEKVQTVVTMLCQAFLAIGAGMALIGAAGALATAGIPGFIAIGVVIAILIGVIAAISVFVEDKQGLIEKINDAGAVIEAIAGVLGRAFGSFIGGLVGVGLSEASTGITDLASTLATFAEQMNAIGEINIDVEGVNNVISAVGSATLTGLGSALESIVTEAVLGKSAMETFSSDATGLASGLKSWQTEMDGIAEVTVPTGIDTLIEGINSANMAGFGSGLASIVTQMRTGKSVMETFSSDASGLATTLKSWGEEMNGIAEVTVPTGISTLVENINAANMAGFGSGLASIVTQMRTGKSTMETFKTDASGLADALVDWQTEMETIAAITVPTGIDELATQISEIKMDTLVSNVLESLGSDFTGDDESSLEKFKTDTSNLATALTTWQTEMEKISAITVPTEAIDQLVTALGKVPKGGGIFAAFKSFFEGSADMEGFSDNLAILGSGIQGFTTALGEDIDLEKMTVAAEAAAVLGDLGNALKGQDFGGWFHESDMSNFGKNLTDFGGKLQEFADIDIDTAKLSTLADSAQTLGRFGNLISHLEISDDNLTSLDSAITQVKTSMDAMKDIDISSGDVANTGKVTKFIANIKALINSVNDAAAVEAGSTTNLKTALDEMNDVILQSSTSKGKNDDSADQTAVGEKMVSSAAQGVTDNAGLITDALSTVMTGAASAVSDTSAFSSAGTGMITAMMLGITGSSSLISTAMSGAVSSAKAAIDTSGFSSVGASMMSGLASGISSGKSAAISAAAAAAAEALAAAKAKLDINSPSKKMIEVGENFTEGFSIGIKNLTYKAKRTAGNMAQGTIDSFQQATDAVLSVLSADVSGGPVIRPVLDLSEVKLGASKINDMFGGRVPVSVAANANVISSNMSSRDSVSNRDILDALDRLNSSLGGPRGDSITINGITYDDGSNVYMAVKDLVKAVRVGRRV